MTRKKVKLAFIANDSSSKATYKKRKKGLMKKVNELSTLCGINACAIIYSPYDSNPEVWPSNSGVQRIISEFRTLPEMDQNKKMTKDSQSLRQFEETKEGQPRDGDDRSYLIDQCLKDVNRRIEILGNSRMELGESSNNVAAEAIQTLPIIHGSARVSRVDVHITF
ncbi:hypothetical protein HID58_048102 [Brassica napus]|uniref:MADS-box domain-containing protein n=1 Tax=Brassica napus TaxID=3708 RepID=A0ABQ8B163_BRANA|nr:hypothetical protein HID58_048102 [Brassica napus]